MQPIEEWDYSSKSKEQIQARLMHRQIAAMRREKALAYSSTHQVFIYFCFIVFVMLDYLI